MKRLLLAALASAPLLVCLAPGMASAVQKPPPGGGDVWPTGCKTEYSEMHQSTLSGTIVLYDYLHWCYSGGKVTSANSWQDYQGVGPSFSTVSHTEGYTDWSFLSGIPHTAYNSNFTWQVCQPASSGGNTCNAAHAHIQGHSDGSFDHTASHS